MTAAHQSSGLTVRVVNEDSGFKSLQDDWTRLGGEIPFRDFRWHHTWWEHFGHDHDLMILAIYDQAHCIAIAPFFVQRILSLGRVAQFLGSGEVASDQQTILAPPNRSTEVGRCVANWFASDQNHVADLLQLDGIDNGCPAFSAFVSSANELGYSLVDRSTLHTWRIQLPHSTEEYVAGLSKSCRRKYVPPLSDLRLAIWKYPFPMTLQASRKAGSSLFFYTSDVASA